MNKIALTLITLCFSASLWAQMPILQLKVPKSSAAEAPDINPSLKDREVQPLSGQKELQPQIQEPEVIEPKEPGIHLEESGELETSEGPQY